MVRVHYVAADEGPMASATVRWPSTWSRPSCASSFTTRIRLLAQKRFFEMPSTMRPMGPADGQTACTLRAKANAGWLAGIAQADNQPIRPWSFLHSCHGSFGHLQGGLAGAVRVTLDPAIRVEYGLGQHSVSHPTCSAATSPPYLRERAGTHLHPYGFCVQLT